MIYIELRSIRPSPWTQEKYNLDYYVELTQELVDHGIDVLAVKDMAGLLKPRAATLLIGALRERFPDLPIHVHTHDTAGTLLAMDHACCLLAASSDTTL